MTVPNSSVSPRVLLCDPAGRVIAATAANGWTADWSGQVLWTLPGLDDQAARSLEDAHRAAMAGTQRRTHLPAASADGSDLHVDAVPVRGIDGADLVLIVLDEGDDAHDPFATDRLRALAELSAALNAAHSTHSVIDLVVEHGTAVVDAQFLNVATLDVHGENLHLAQTFADPDVADRWRVLPVHGDLRTPLHDALDTGTAVFVDPERRRREYSALVADTDALGLHTTAAFPLRDSTSGQVFAVLGVGWHHPVGADSDIAARTGLLADLCAQAYARCHRSEVAAQLIDELQRSLIIDIDAPSELDIAVAYRPAERSIGFGGDWYDTVDAAPDTTALVVGDVAGHGISAAAHMASAKATIRTAILTSPTTDHVLHDASRSLQHLGSAYVATAAIVWCRPDGAISWSLAGHPPPILRGPAGTVILDGPQHPPLGMIPRPAPCPTTVLPVDGLLVLYTDGLIERRDQPLHIQLERLRHVIDTLPEGIDAGAVRDRIIDAMVPSDPADDIAIVVVRRLHPSTLASADGPVE